MNSYAKKKAYQQACQKKAANGMINTASGDWVQRGSFMRLAGVSSTTAADHYFAGYKLKNVG